TPADLGNSPIPTAFDAPYDEARELDVQRTSMAYRKGQIMYQAVNFTSVALILLDALLIWSCWAVDKHMMSRSIEKRSRAERK
ncbi:MAG TPA: hypothetical protein VGN04_03495, partial [Herbaspirillum sp.]